MSEAAGGNQSSGVAPKSTAKKVTDSSGSLAGGATPKTANFLSSFHSSGVTCFLFVHPLSSSSGSRWLEFSVLRGGYGYVR